jgi:molybdenum cofactor cytidylyltransferase
MIMKICAVVMASGFSRRAGINKLLHVIDGKPMARYILETLAEVRLDRVVVVTRYPEIEAWALELGYAVVWNNEAEEGQSSSIRLGVAAAPGFNGYMFFPADQPHIGAAAIRAILREFASRAESIVVPLFDGQRGSPVLFPSRLERKLLGLRGDTGGRPIISEDDRVCFLEIGDAHQGKDYDVIDKTQDGLL